MIADQAAVLKILEDLVKKAVEEYLGGFSSAFLLALTATAQKTGKQTEIVESLREQAANLPPGVNKRDQIVTVLNRLADGLEGHGDLSPLSQNPPRLQ